MHLGRGARRTGRTLAGGWSLRGRWAEGVGEQTGREGPVQAPGGAFWLRREPSREEGGRPLLEAPSSLRGRCRRGNRSGNALTSPSATVLCFGADVDTESAQARPTRVSVAVVGTQGSPAGWHRAGGGTQSHWARREERLAGHRGPGHRCTSLRAARRTANHACAHADADPAGSRRLTAGSGHLSMTAASGPALALPPTAGLGARGFTSLGRGDRSRRPLPDQPRRRQLPGGALGGGLCRWPSCAGPQD